MKKVLFSIGASIVLASVIFVSCKKENAEKNLNKNSPSTGQVISTYSPSISEGEKHNIVLGRYLDEHGYNPSSELSKMKVEEMLQKIIQIEISEGYISDDFNSDDAASNIMAGYENDGCFGAEGFWKSDSELYSTNVNKLANPDLIRILMNIKGYTGSIENYSTFAHEQLGSLSGLSDEENVMVAGYLSVFDNSLIFWDERTGGNSQVMGAAATADALGWIIGFRTAHRNFLFFPFDIGYANIVAVQYSAVNLN